MTAWHLVLVETSGNQAYIFSTNKLRDIIGGSELIQQVGTELVRGASQCVCASTTELVNQTLSDLKKASSDTIYPVIAMSGKAVLLCPSKEVAHAFVRRWSETLLKEFPGVDATGVFAPVSLDPPENTASVPSAFHELHKQFELARNRRTSPLARFPRLPVVAPCQFSSLPAGNLVEAQGEIIRVSQPVHAKRNAYNNAQKRMQQLHDGICRPFGNPDEMERKFEGLEWVAVIHADGNGLGQLFLNFEQFIKTGTEPALDYLKQYAAFSKELDTITKQAYQTALKAVFPPKEWWPSAKQAEKEIKKAPVIPVVVGGDDLTVIMDGKRALEFTREFLISFCTLSMDRTVAPTISAVCATEKARSLLKGDRLGMCAGVAIVPPHFPFATAYDLAEELLKSAKTVKQQVGPAAAAIDFHILYDSSISSIKEVRDKLKLNGANCTAKPFVVEEPSEKSEHPWVKDHSWERFKNAVDFFQKDGKQGPALPSSQAHYIRQGLFTEDVKTQEAEWTLLGKRYETLNKRWKHDEIASLYFEAADGPRTVFLDALEAEEFMS